MYSLENGRRWLQRLAFSGEKESLTLRDGLIPVGKIEQDILPSISKVLTSFISSIY